MKLVLVWGALAVGYVAAAAISLRWSLIHAGVSALWLPGGLALGLLFLFGLRFWPGVAAGEFAVQLWLGVPALTAGVLAAGRTAGLVFAAYLTRLLVSGASPFEDIADLYKFVAAAFLATPVGALIGAVGLSLSGGVAWSDFGPITWNWWLGDAVGILVGAPVLLVWANRPPRLEGRDLLEGVALALVTVLAGEVAFGDWLPTGVLNYPLAFIFLPVLIWAALRLGLRGAASACLIIAVVAASGTKAGYGPFARGSAAETLLLLQGFIALTTTTALSLAVVVFERTRTETALSQEKAFAERLVDTVPVIVLLLDPDGRIRHVNRYLEEMSGYRRAELLGADWFSGFVSPAQREQGRASFERAMEGGRVEGNINAVRTRDGGEREIEWYNTLLTDSEGRATGLLATGQDITEWRGLERELSAHQARLEELVQERTEALSATNEKLAREIADRELVARELGESERRLLEAQRIAHLGSWEWDLTSGRWRVSDELCRILGLEPGSAPEDRAALLHHVHQRDRGEMEAALDRVVREGGGFVLEHRLVRPDGEERLVQHRAEAIRVARGRPVRVVGTVEDQTERKRAEEKLRQAATVFDNTTEAIVVADGEGRVSAINRAFTEITGYTSGEILGQDLRVLQSGQYAELYREMLVALSRSGQWQGEVWNRHKGGEVYPAWGSISTVRNEVGEITNYVAVFTDISAIKRTEERLSHLAHHDALTDLPNRLLFSVRLEHALERAKRHRGQVALLFVDLDRFKAINDSLGHATGDAVLQEVARRLKRCVRAEDTVARLGGDEFTVIMDEVAHSEDAAVLAGKIIEVLRQPYAVDGQMVNTSASVGISVFPNDADQADDLAKGADAAMYYAKNQGRNTYRFFTAELTDKTLHHMELEQGLRQALAEGEFTLYYQPQIALDSGRIVGVEALLRWPHAEWGVMPAEGFIRVAEDSGLIEPIGEWALRTACLQAREWRSEGLPPLRMSVNVSVRQLLRGRLIERLEGILSELGLHPGEIGLELEVREEVLRVAEENRDGLGRLRTLGVMLAVDDFGSGCSSLSVLKQLPVDSLKIGSSFVDTALDDQVEGSIVEAIITMAHSLGLRVIAEGTEREEQAGFLRSRGCDEVQGFLYSEPLPAERIGVLLREGRPYL